MLLKMEILCSLGLMFNMRVGFGKDIHRLVIGRKLVLAGVKIPFHLGEKAHSDGDVVYHAIMDSVLGALALGDIGKHFPDSNPQFKNIDSSILVKKVSTVMKSKHFEIGNIDVVISLEKPKIGQYTDEMRKNIAELLETNIENVSVKAGTNEGLGDIGKSKAVEATSIVLLKEIKN